MSRNGRYLFTSESVTEGHPDKIADQISDSILDAILSQDPVGRVACETLVTTGLAIIAGEITEYASNCAVPIVHKAGEVAPETSATAHWWKNTGKKTVVLISADLLKVGDDAHMM